MSKSFRQVKEFEFPSSCGFTASAGKIMVKGYARGGAVKKAEGGAVSPKRESMVDKALRKAREEHAVEQAAKLIKDKPTGAGSSIDGVLRGNNPFRNSEREKALEGYAKGGPVARRGVPVASREPLIGSKKPC